MRRLVSTLSPELALLLERDLFKRADLHLVAARSVEELITFTREGAELCLVEALLPDGDAMDALDAVRATPEGSHVPVVLVATEDAPPADASGFSAVLTLPAPPGAVEDLLAKLLEEPRRKGDRRAATARVRDARGEPLGRLVDLSRGGLALRTRRALAAGTTLEMKLELPLQRTPIDARARVLRVAGDHVALALEQPSAVLAEALELLMSPAPVEGGMAFRPLPTLGPRAAAIGGVLLDGPARAALQSFLAATPAEPPRLVIEAMVPFDEAALDRWIALVAGVERLELYACPVWFRALADRAPATLGRTGARIVSLQVGLRCPGCDDEHELEVELPAGAADVRRGAVQAQADVPCFVCGGPVALTEPAAQMFL